MNTAARLPQDVDVFVLNTNNIRKNSKVRRFTWLATIHSMRFIVKHALSKPSMYMWSLLKPFSCLLNDQRTAKEKKC